MALVIISLANIAAAPEHGRTVALILLIAFFLLAISAVPFEFNFYSALKDQNLFPSILAEVLVFVVMVTLLAGAVLDWFNTPEKIGVMLVLVVLLLLVMVWFLHWRTRLISALLYKATKSSAGNLEKLLAEMRKEDKRTHDDGDKGAGGKPNE